MEAARSTPSLSAPFTSDNGTAPFNPHNWRRVTIQRPRARLGTGYLVTARRALLRSSNTSRPRRGTRKPPNFPTSLRHELKIKTVRFSEDIVYLESTKFKPSGEKETMEKPSSSSAAASEKVEKQKEPHLSRSSPLNPLLETAFANKGPLNIGTNILILYTLRDMEEEFLEQEEERMIAWEEAADEFCGCTREDLLKWHASLSSPVEARNDSSPEVMSLLLRSFFDSQYTFLDERKCMAKKGSRMVAKQIDRERNDAALAFLTKTRKDFEGALWSYFMVEWIKS